MNRVLEVSAEMILSQDCKMEIDSLLVGTLSGEGRIKEAKE